MANPHSLSETVQYAKEKSGLTETASVDREYTWNIFGMSYSGNKAVMKNFKKIARDLYGYYGVTEEDIINKTERYSSLVTSLIELAKRDGLIKGFF